MQHTDVGTGKPVEQLESLVYELLDAHIDTMNIGRDLTEDLEWLAHLEYLRGLQRVGREVLADVTSAAAA